MHEVAIVGAGPIGLELAVAFKRRGIDYVQIEAGQVGSTMAWWAPGTKYFSSPERIEIAGVPLVVPGQEKATREQYLDYLRLVAMQFELEVRTYERVVELRREAGGFCLHSEASAHGVGGPGEEARRGRGAGPRLERRETRARRVVLAIGNMHLPRRLGIPGEDLPHVSHYLDEPHAYFGRRVLVVGGKNSAVEAALRLHRVGAEVALCYRRDRLDPERIKYWLLPEIEWLIGKSRIGWIPSTCVTAIAPGHAQVCGASAEGEPDPSGGSRRVEADFVLLLTGYVQDSTLFEQAGIELVDAERKPAHNPRTMETNVSGLYIAGTAAGGSQRRTRVFIETSHVHVDRIVAAIVGESPPEDSAAVDEAMVES